MGTRRVTLLRPGGSGHRDGALARLQDRVDQAVLHRGVRGEDLVALDVVADCLDRLAGVLGDHLLEHTGKDVEQVSRDIDRDKILTADAAVEYGLIDAILESRKGSLTPA